MQIISWIIIILAVLILVPLLGVPLIVYRILLVRTEPEKWGRTCSLPDDPETCRMFQQGLEWEAQNKEAKKEVAITSHDGLKLVGEYFDFGFKKAAVIIAGRMESCLYSYYYAEPFRKAGCNVLVMDNRAHGLSEGRYSCCGFKEYRDVLRWCELMHDEYGNEEIILHGICIGSSTAMFVLTAKNCPDYIRGMVGEGMYVNFYESLKNHMLEQKRPMYPFIYIIAFWTWIFSSAPIMTDGPLKRMKRLTKPILFLHSREDIYSLPELAQKLYDTCPSDKQIVWFDWGAHSRIRINHEKKYDDAVIEFANRIL